MARKTTKTQVDVIANMSYSDVQNLEADYLNDDRVWTACRVYVAWEWAGFEAYQAQYPGGWRLWASRVTMLADDANMDTAGIMECVAADMETV